MSTNFEDDDDKKPREREPVSPNVGLFSRTFEVSAPKPWHHTIGASTPRGARTLSAPGVMPEGSVDDLILNVFGIGGTGKRE
jgi:hypothetical protein